MNNRRPLLIAVGALALVGLILFAFIATQSHQVSAPPPKPALIAAHNIPAKTRLTYAMLAVAQRPADQVDASAYTSASAVVGQVSAVPIARDEIITSNEVVSVSALGLAIQLRPGMRAVSIPVDPVKDVSNLVQPGDHVDVIAAPPKYGTLAPAFTILRDITVLSSGMIIEPPIVTASATAAPGATPTPNPGADQQEVRTVTLEVTPDQAALLTAADINTTLRLALRSPQEPASSLPPDHLVYPAATPQPGPVTQPIKQVPTGVPVINGDTVSYGAK